VVAGLNAIGPATNVLLEEPHNDAPVVPWESRQAEGLFTSVVRRWLFVKFSQGRDRATGDLFSNLLRTGRVSALPVSTIPAP
jgi:hypothetical protein